MFEVYGFWLVVFGFWLIFSNVELFTKLNVNKKLETKNHKQRTINRKPQTANRKLTYAFPYLCSPKHS